MKRFQCMPTHLAMGEGVPHGQRWTYASSHPLDEMMTADYFRAQRTMFKPGDTIRILEMQSNTLNIAGNRVLAYVDVLVVRSDAEDIELRLEHPVVNVPIRVVDGKPAAEWSAERYIRENGDVKWNAKKQVHEVFEGKTIVAETKDKDEAWRIATGAAPLPEAEAA